MNNKFVLTFLIIVYIILYSFVVYDSKISLCDETGGETAVSMERCADAGDGRSFVARHVIALPLLGVWVVSVFMFARLSYGLKKQWCRQVFLLLMLLASIRPLFFSSSDWHGEAYFVESILLGLLGFPFGVLVLLGGILLIGLVSTFPYYLDETPYGLFSIAVAVLYVVQVAVAYWQWCVLGLGRIKRKTE